MIQKAVSEVVVKEKWQFDWVAFLLWLLTLIFSLVPVYISTLKYLGQKGYLDEEFWFECITKNDILWIFATLILFALFNSFINYRTNSLKKNKSTLIVLYIIALFAFAIVNATWFCLKYFVEKPATWAIWVGVVLMICSLAISTPLEINSISVRDDKNDF